MGSNARCVACQPQVTESPVGLAGAGVGEGRTTTINFMTASLPQIELTRYSAVLLSTPGIAPPVNEGMLLKLAKGVIIQQHTI